MAKKIGLILLALFFIISLIACSILSEKIADGEKQLAEGQMQFDNGQLMLRSGEYRLNSGKKQLSTTKNVYGVVKYTPISAVRYVPVAGFVFKHVDRKIASGDQQVASGEKKIKEGKGKLAAGKIALENGKKQLVFAKKILFWLKVVTGILGFSFLVLLSVFFKAMKKC